MKHFSLRYLMKIWDVAFAADLNKLLKLKVN